MIVGVLLMEKPRYLISPKGDGMWKLIVALTVMTLFALGGLVSLTRSEAEASDMSADIGWINSVEIEGKLFAITAYGIVDVEFRSTKYADGRKELESEVVTAFFENEWSVAADEVSFDFQFDPENKKSPVEAEVSLETFIPGCGVVSITMEWQDGGFKTFREQEFDADGIALRKERGVEVEIEANEGMGDITVCDLPLKNRSIHAGVVELDGYIKWTRIKQLEE